VCACLTLCEKRGACRLDSYDFDIGILFL
jgi:hypothetical protein